MTHIAARKDAKNAGHVVRLVALDIAAVVNRQVALIDKPVPLRPDKTIASSSKPTGRPLAAVANDCLYDSRFDSATAAADIQVSEHDMYLVRGAQ